MQDVTAITIAIVAAAYLVRLACVRLGSSQSGCYACQGCIIANRQTPKRLE